MVIWSLAPPCVPTYHSASPSRRHTSVFVHAGRCSRFVSHIARKDSTTTAEEELVPARKGTVAGPKVMSAPRNGKSGCSHSTRM
ncbi:MAG: hypothetical protein BWY76_00500 [bacterium ADurb.Bin429]|nr:MAG: hypothetical protein BWY76_00500 [bacterium ADurb.Bin429]